MSVMILALRFPSWESLLLFEFPRIMILFVNENLGRRAQS